LVRIFLVNARERELGKTLRRFSIKGGLFCSCRQRPLRLKVGGKRNARNNQPNTEDPFHSARILNRTLRACHAEAFSVGEAGWTFSNKSQSLMRFVHLFIFAALLSAFQITAVSAADPIDNPLLKESTLPYHLPPFDQIKDQHFVRAHPAALRRSRQTRPRSRVRLSPRALLQGFRPGRRETFRFRQGKTEENQCRAGDVADPVRTKCSEREKRVFDRCRSQRRSRRSVRQSDGERHRGREGGAQD